ncbi:AAA family ATPase [Microbacterium sp. NPDC055910]|uniref:AAA family ATPase n=1 Tax=Microbacterium sp. NPDC055910 TaxID=3345659 RepID=UPI0035DDCCE3
MTRSAAYERVTAALSAGGWKMRTHGRDRARAQCPAHGGDDLNLSVARGDQGVLVRCWSQACSEAEIADALGLQLAELFDADGRARYNYGAGHFVTRTRTPQGKRISQTRTPTTTALWIPEGSRPIAESAVVLLAEGEKAADALVRMGATCAATWPGGSGGVGKVDLSPLAGRTVVICPDADEPGERALRALVARLDGVAAEVKVWRTPPTFGDASGLLDSADLYVAGGSLDDLVEDLVPTVEAGEDWGEIPLEDLVAGLLDGTVETAAPSILTREDGQALLYPGKVNGIHGDSGAGKSWTALLAAAQLLADGRHVAYVDLEDSAADIVGRLLALGVEPRHIVERFHYHHPESRFHVGADRFLSSLQKMDAALVVIDSTGESLSLEGANPNADEEIAAWFREAPKRIAATGPAVLILDHMPKSSADDLWPIGSQRKRAAIDGAQYLQEIVSAFSREKAGAAKLVTAKDRHGTYARGQKVALLHVTPEGGTVRLTLAAPDAVATISGAFEPTTLMERASRALEDSIEPLTGARLISAIGGNKRYAARAIAALVDRGNVTISIGSRNARCHSLVQPYREGDLPPSIGEGHPPIGILTSPRLGTGVGGQVIDLPPGQVGAGRGRSSSGVEVSA